MVRASNFAPLAICAFLVVSSASAQTLYSNFNSSDVTSGGRSVKGSATFAGENSPAYTFTPSLSGSVAQIDVRMSLSSGSIQVSLWTAAPGCGTGIYFASCGGIAPTTLLGTWPLVAAGPSLFRATGISGVSLVSGSSYYAQLSATTPQSNALWQNNVQSVNSTLWQCGGSDATFTNCLGHTTIGSTTMGALTISAVPEPASAILFLSGLGYAVLRTRRKPTKNEHKESSSC